MNALALAPALVVALVLVQFIVPGRAVYHYGWFNVALAGLAILSISWCRLRARKTPRYAAVLAVATLGVCALGAAGIANGLFAPDDALIVGAPGTGVPVDDLHGTLLFPSTTDADTVIRLQRGASSLDVPAHGVRLAGAFMLAQQPRWVVAIDVRDLSGAHLTITQPNGSAFLSPVLTLPQTQTIRAGLSLPFDTFAVPAAHRIFDVVFFDAREARTLPRVRSRGRALLLFAAQDDEGHAIANGIRFALDGESIALAGVRLRPRVLAYPGVRVIAVPPPIVAALGVALILAAAAWALALDRAAPRPTLDAAAENR